MEAFKSTILGAALRRTWHHPSLLYNDEKTAPRPLELSPTQSLSNESKGLPVVEVSW